MATKQQESNMDSRDIVLDSLEHPNRGISGNQRQPKDRFWLKMIPFLAIVVLLLLIVVTQLGLYRVKALHGFSSWVATWSRFPSAISGTHVVTYTAFADEKQVVEKAAGSLDEASVNAVALNKIVRDLTFEDVYVKRGITIDDSEVEKAFQNLFGAPSDSTDAARISQLLIGLTPLEVKSSIIKPFLLKQKLTDDLRADDTLIQKQKALIESLHIRTTQDPTSVLAFEKEGRTVLVSEIQYLSTQALSGSLLVLTELTTGETSAVQETASEFSFYLVTDKTENEAGQGYVAFREIVVQKYSADVWVTEKLENTRVVDFVPDITWSAACGSFTVKRGTCPYVGVLSEENRNQLEQLLSGENSLFSPQFLLQ